MIEESFVDYFSRLPVDEVESYLQVAIQVGASAIHLDPEEGHLRVRFRLTNRLQDITRLKHVHDERYSHPLIGQVKARAGLNLISRYPDTGRFMLKIGGNLHSFRCSTCRESGFSGFQAVHEVMEFDPPLRRRMAAGMPEEDLRYLNLAQGMETMKEDAILKAARGLVSLGEAIMVTAEPLDRISANIERARSHLRGDSIAPSRERRLELPLRPKGLLRPMAALRDASSTYLSSAAEMVQPPEAAEP